MEDELTRNYRLMLENYQKCRREKEDLLKQINELNEKIEKNQKENEETIKKKNDEIENLKSVIEQFPKKNIWGLK